MNRQILFDALSEIDHAYVESAAAAMDTEAASASPAKHRPLRLILVAATLALILAAIFIPIAIGRDRVSTPTVSTPIAPTTETPPDTPESEKPYYFQTSPNYVGLDIDYVRLPNDVFRTEGLETTVIPKQPPAYTSIPLPESFTFDGITYEVDPDVEAKTGSVWQYRVLNVSKFYSSGEKPLIYYDHKIGQVVGMYNFPFNRPTSEEYGMKKTERTELAIKRYFPFLDLENYELTYYWDYSENKTESGSVTLRYTRMIGGFPTDDEILAWYDRGALVSLICYNYNSYEDFDESILEGNYQEEHDKILDSLIEYVRNGHEIEEPTVSSRLVRLEDQRFAIRYDISLHTADGSDHTTLNVCLCFDNTVGQTETDTCL